MNPSLLNVVAHAEMLVLCEATLTPPGLTEPQTLYVATRDDSVTFNAALGAASLGTLSGAQDLRGIIDLVEARGRIQHTDETWTLSGVRALGPLVVFPHPFDAPSAKP